MKKVFITAISLQTKKDLEKGIYTPDGFNLHQNIETSFPIIPIIKENAGRLEDVKIIALRTENEDVKDNYAEFVNEVKALDIKEEQIIDIPVEENQNKVIGLSTLIRIIDEISEDSLVYGDITFGTKPMSAIILYAMSFAEKLKDVEVEQIVYGELPREQGKSKWDRAKLYDLTAYKYLSDVIEQLNALEISNPRAALKKLIDM